MKTVDARGLSCPEPVLLSKKAAEEGEFPFEVLIDDVTPFENIKRFAAQNNNEIKSEEKDDGYVITFVK